MPGRDSSSAVLRVDPAAECIWRDGEKVGVPPKAFLVLRRLMERPGQLVTKDELLAGVWPNTFVTERVLNNAIGQLRQALGDDPKRPRFIETVHRRGFRWIGPVAAETAPAAPAIPFVDTVDLQDDDAATFVGRAQSLAELGRGYARAVAGQRQLVLVSGEPGIGKTALVDEFIKRLGENRVTADGVAAFLLARGQCIEGHGAGDLYRPFREAVEDLLRHGGEEMRSLLRTHAPSWLLSMPELSSPAELETLRRSVIASTSESVQRELERAIEAASAQRALVLVLEDLHWSEPATVALLWALAARREPARLMIVGTYRPVDAITQQHPITRLKRELVAKRQCVELALDGLPGDAVVAFLDRHFPRHELSSTFAARLCEQTTGNPLFLLNALADFEQREWLQEQEGVWRCTVALDSLFAAVPESTRELIAFRLDQLSVSTRELLEAASIVGTPFATQAVAAASERECAEVEAQLEPLARAALFLQRRDEIEWPDGTRGCRYEFRHALYRQVLLGGITPRRRQLLHRRIAHALESSHGDRVGEIAAVLSLHHEQAGDALRAVDYIDMLVQQAYARSASHEAEAMLRHAVALLKRAPKSPVQQDRLLKATTAHGVASGTVRGFTSAETLRTFDDARALGRSRASSRAHIVSLGNIVLAKILQGSLREAHSLAEEILALARADESPDPRITAHLSAGTALMCLGEIDAALQQLESAVAATDLRSPTAARPDSMGFDPAAPAYCALGYALCLAGRATRGRACVASAIEIARTLVMPWHLGNILNTATSVAAIRNDLVETRRLAAETLAFAEQNSLVNTSLSRVHLGWVEVLETLDPAGIEPLRQAVAAIGTRLSISRANSLLADACLAVGRIDEAAQALDAAFDARGEERVFDAELLRLRAMTLLGRARSSRSKSALRVEAVQALEQAIEAANSQGTRLFGLRAIVDLCRLWLTTGKRKAAQQRLTEALGAFEEGFGETDLRDARALLDKLNH